MSRPTATRPLVRVPVPPGPDGAARLIPALAAALDGSGPAVAPVPTVSAATSNDYVMTVLAAVRADDDLPLESDNVAVVVATSGSTGAPRGVLLTAGNLTCLTPHVHDGAADPQWILALPVTSMGGINVLVRALATQRPPIVLPSIGGAGPFTVTSFVDAVTQASSRATDVRVSLVPAQLARLMSDDAGIAALQGCRQILVGGAATRPALLENAATLGIRLTTTYGATETAGGCVFDGRPLPGVTVTTAGEPGTITIDGPSVALGYRGDPIRTRELFTAAGFVTSDLGQVGSDGRLTVLGRADDVIVVRGVNVSPLAVERVISDLPDVAAIAVVAAPDATGEPTVHAFVEARDAAPDVEQAAVALVVDRLGWAARPIMHRVDRLPHLPNGKVDRRRLQERAASGREDD